MKNSNTSTFGIHPYRDPGKRTPARKKQKFPCKKCFEIKTCTHVCELVEKDDDKITEYFKDGLCCPDCGADRFLEGPSGGLAVNIFCANCRHGFNHMGPFGVERIDRILPHEKD